MSKGRACLGVTSALCLVVAGFIFVLWTDFASFKDEDVEPGVKRHSLGIFRISWSFTSDLVHHGKDQRTTIECGEFHADNTSVLEGCTSEGFCYAVQVLSPLGLIVSGFALLVAVGFVFTDLSTVWWIIHGSFIIVASIFYITCTAYMGIVVKECDDVYEEGPAYWVSLTLWIVGLLVWVGSLFVVNGDSGGASSIRYTTMRE